MKIVVLSRFFWQEIDKSMNGQIFIVFSCSILLRVISICNALCYEDFKDELPKRIQWWKRDDYGLEMSGLITEDANLMGIDKTAQDEAKAVGPHLMMIQLDRLINSNKGKNLPDFTIYKLDPISYEYKKIKMLITFSNVNFSNLDGYAYDKKAAKFSRTGVYKKGNFKIDETTYTKIKEKNDKDQAVASFYNRIDTINDERVLRRKDCKWSLGISAKVVTKQDNEIKPIIIETAFKIQPDKTINEGQIETDETPLKARGVVKIEIHDLEFNVSLDITRIDDGLRPFLDPLKRSYNLVPDFDVNYSMTAIEVKEIKLLPYGEDDNFPVKTDEEEHVNDNLPEANDSSKETLEESQPVVEEQKEKFITDEELNEEVAKHFNALKDLIQKNQREIRKKLCLNVLPKMAWKVMQMESKKQLGHLFYQIIAYEDGFQEKTKLPKFTTKEYLNLAKDYATAKFINLKNSIGLEVERTKNDNTWINLHRIFGIGLTKFQRMISNSHR